MTDLLLFRARQASAMRALMARAGASRIAALNLDTDVDLEGWLGQLDFVRYRDVLGVEGPNQIGVASFEMAESWYKTREADPTVAYGLSFGQYLEYEMKRVFSVLCRQIAFLNELRPTRILLADDGSIVARASTAYASVHGVDVVSVATAEGPQTDWVAPGGRRRMGSPKELVKALLCAASSWPRMLDRSRALTLYVQPDSHARSLIENVLTRTRHRLVLPAFDRSHLGHPRVILTDWEREPASGSDPLRVRTWSAVEAAKDRIELSYHGVPLWSAVRPVARAYWDRSWDTFARQARYAARVFDKFHLDAAVVAQDQSGLDKVMVMMARARKVPSFCYSHGIELYTFLGYPRTNAGMQAVYGEECRRICVQFRSVGQVIAVGNDELGQLRRRVQALGVRALRRKAKLQDLPAHVILYAAGVYVDLWSAEEPADQNEMLRSVCRCAHRLQDAVMLIRLHPSTAAYESVEVKHAIVAAHGNAGVHMDPGLTLEEALAASDVVVTGWSTVGVQAIAAGKPLVVFDPLSADSAEYVRGRAGAVARTEDELTVVLQRLISSPTARDDVLSLGQRFLADRVLGYGDGKAGARMLAEIERACAAARGRVGGAIRAIQ